MKGGKGNQAKRAKVRGEKRQGGQVRGVKERGKVEVRKDMRQVKRGKRYKVKS